MHDASAASEESQRRTERRNVWAVSLTSFFTDVSSEMVLHLVPLYLAGVLGVGAGIVGLVEGAASSVAGVVKVASGWLSDRVRQRKGLAVLGYALSAAAKPFFLVATSWAQVAAVRWTERVGKGVRTAPRDALLADSVAGSRRGLIFGLHRAADTAGAVVGLAVAWLVVRQVLGAGGSLDAATFQRVVLWSLVPAFVAVAVLAWLAREPEPQQPEDTDDDGDDGDDDGAGDAGDEAGPAGETEPVRGLGRPFLVFLLIVGVFDLGNSADAFLVLRAAERGLSVADILLMLLAFNVVYALVSTPAGGLSDRFGRRRVLVAGWLLYAAVYLGLALADSGFQVALLVAIYGAYHGLTVGTAKAMVADLVPSASRGTAYGLLAAMLALLDLPASLIAGVLWSGVDWLGISWGGFGPAAPFVFGAAMAGAAAVAMLLWRPERQV